MDFIKLQILSKLRSRASIRNNAKRSQEREKKKNFVYTSNPEPLLDRRAFFFPFFGSSELRQVGWGRKGLDLDRLHYS